MSELNINKEQDDCKQSKEFSQKLSLLKNEIFKKIHQLQEHTERELQVLNTFIRDSIKNLKDQNSKERLDIYNERSTFKSEILKEIDIQISNEVYCKLEKMENRFLARLEDSVQDLKAECLRGLGYQMKMIEKEHFDAKSSSKMK